MKTDLSTAARFADRGTSSVEALAELPGGSLLLALNESNLLNIKDTPLPSTAELASMATTAKSENNYYSGKIIALNPNFQPTGTVTLDAGSDVFLQDLDVANPMRPLVGGAAGDEATIFELTLTNGP